MSEVWAKLEGHAVNGVFPLLRYLGGSNHSVVFLTQSAKHSRTELALKLVPAVPALAQLQIARWRATAGLVHPRLIQIFETGQCQIGERQFLYVVTDYADQNLAQLLERRALTGEETTEMLGPVLEALVFLHNKKLVQGRLKPSNVLVVGDQIRLSSDAIRPVSETGRASNLNSVYMPPEAREGTRTGASDVWALGVTLCEALTRKQPTGLHSGELVLPAELSPAFRGVVARCLKPRAAERPTVKELQVWARGAQLVASLSESGSHRMLDAAVSGDDAEAIGAAGRQQPRAADAGTHSSPKFSTGLVVLAILGALALFVLGWAAVRSPGVRAAPRVPDAVVEDPHATMSAPTSALVSTVSETPAGREPLIADSIGRPVSPQASAGTAEDDSSPALSEVIPDVPERARKSIRGRVRVSVRLIVDPEGKVFAALVERPGPSRYFDKLALEAAEQWTFPPATAQGQRLMMVRFDFTRGGATARATPLD